MNRRSFLKLMSALAASLCLPFEAPGSEPDELSEQTIVLTYPSDSHLATLTIISDSNKFALELQSIDVLYPKPKLIEYTSIKAVMDSRPSFHQEPEYLNASVLINREIIKELDKIFVNEDKVRCSLSAYGSCVEFEAHIAKMLISHPPLGEPYFNADLVFNVKGMELHGRE